MMVISRQNKELAEHMVDLAVEAVVGSPHVMDMPMAEFDPSPSFLDIDEGEKMSAITCPICGCLLCEH